MYHIATKDRCWNEDGIPELNSERAYAKTTRIPFSSIYSVFNAIDYLFHRLNEYDQHIANIEGIGYQRGYLHPHEETDRDYWYRCRHQDNKSLEELLSYIGIGCNTLEDFYDYLDTSNGLRNWF